MTSGGTVLVIGGSGLLGRHIVEELKNRGNSVAVLDIVQRYDDVSFYVGDVTDEQQILSAFQRSGATSVIHCVSPHGSTAPAAEVWKVNVTGTKNVISACLACGIRTLVYTSSAGVAFSGQVDILGVDETYPYPQKAMGVYMETKIIAEKAVLEANGQGQLSTVVLRPSGIFGPGDRQTIVGLDNVYLRGKTGVQIGNNTNLTDWTYVTNVAHAHVLALDKVGIKTGSPETDVAGQVFFITNDEPWPFWDFCNAVWDRFDAIYPGRRVKKKPFIIPRWLGLIMGALSECIGWITGKPATFTRWSITFSCTARWYRIDKAKKLLGYKPEVSMKEGIDLTIKWWKTQVEARENVQK